MYFHLLSPPFKSLISGIWIFRHEMLEQKLKLPVLYLLSSLPKVSSPKLWLTEIKKRKHTSCKNFFKNLRKEIYLYYTLFKTVPNKLRGKNTNSQQQYQTTYYIKCKNLSKDSYRLFFFIINWNSRLLKYQY